MVQKLNKKKNVFMSIYIWTSQKSKLLYRYQQLLVTFLVYGYTERKEENYILY